MAWTLTRGLQNLRAQVDARWPDRDKTSDGTIGDAAHQASTSSHNPDDTAGSTPEWDGDPDSTAEVRAWDMDVDLREPGATAQQVVDHLRSLPGLASVIRYMIYNRTMYHSRDGFAPTPYSGASAHLEHIHFTGAFTQAADDNATFDYRLDEVNMPTPEEYAQAVASKLAGDLVNPASGLFKATVARVRDGVGTFWWDAYHSAEEDDTYKAADAAGQRRMRNAEDTVRSVVGGPVSEDDIIGAVDQVDEAVWSKISDPATPDEQVAAALDQLLGDRKAAVLALMR